MEMKLVAALSTVVLLAGIGPGHAAATSGEAERLAGLFRSYLGPASGAVKVTPSGEDYDVRLDLTAFLKDSVPAMGVEQHVTMEISPIEWKLTPLGDGRWKLREDQALHFSLLTPSLVIEARLDSVKSTAVFDEAVSNFTSDTTEYVGLSVSEKLVTPQQTVSVRYSADKIVKQASASGTAEACDSVIHYDITGFREEIKSPPTPGGPPGGLSFATAAPSGSSDTHMEALNVAAITDLWRWFAAHPSPAARTADQITLRKKLLAALPLFRQVKGVTSFDGFVIETPGGPVKLRQALAEVEMSGLSSSARIREHLQASGLRLPIGMVPEWAQGLVPSRFNLDLVLSGFDLLAPATLIANTLEPGKTPPIPPSTQSALGKALFPTGHVTLDIAPSDAKAPFYSISTEGRLNAGPAAAASGEGVIRVDGMDPVMEVLRDVPQAAGLLSTFAAAIAAAQIDEQRRMTWNITKPESGELLVNGMTLMKIMSLER